MNFSFATASKIIFGRHSSEKLPQLLGGRKRILMVTGKNADKAEALSSRFEKNSIVSLFRVEHEPTTEVVNEGTKLAREKQCEAVVAIGGGSVIDAAKAIAAMAANKGDLLDYLEVIGAGKPLSEPPLFCIAAPTTAGTGAEVTKNSVIKSLEHNVKVSLRSDAMYPDIALVDPVLTYSMPPELTASTGVDALTHLLETFVSNQANPFIDMICREGLTRISRSLSSAYHDRSNESARTDMAMASMLGGMALANVKLGAVHGFAGPMGGMYPIPHGTVCASLVSAVIETNIDALKESGEDLSKYYELARILTGNENAVAEDAIVWTENLVSELQIPALSSFGLKEDDFAILVEKAKVASSMKGNPVVLNDEQLTWILEKSL